MLHLYAAVSAISQSFGQKLVHTFSQVPKRTDWVTKSIDCGYQIVRSDSSSSGTKSHTRVDRSTEPGDCRISTVDPRVGQANTKENSSDTASSQCVKALHPAVCLSNSARNGTASMNMTQDTAL